MREVLRLKHAVGLSYWEISEATGVGKTAVYGVCYDAGHAVNAGRDLGSRAGRRNTRWSSRGARTRW